MTPWEFCRESHIEWRELRYLIENKFCMQGKSNSVIVGYLNEEDLRNEIALSDTYRLGPDESMLVRRYPISSMKDQWMPPSVKLESLRQEITRQRGHIPDAELLKLLLKEQTLRKAHAQGPPHPSLDVINNRCLGVRVNPTRIDTVSFPRCRRCNWMFGKHRERQCPTANHPAFSPRWRGVSRIPAPTGVPHTNREEVPAPTTANDLAQVRWIDRDGRFWVAKSKKHGTRPE